MLSHTSRAIGPSRASKSSFDFAPFAEARAWAQQQGFASGREYLQDAKAGLIPVRFPRQPHLAYRANWLSWGDFLGNARTATQFRRYMPYADAKALVHKLGCGSYREFKKLRGQGLLNPLIPTHPEKIYESEWSDWAEFLGAKCRSRQKRVWLTFEGAKACVRKLGIRDLEGFERSAKEGLLPESMPRNLYRAWPLEWKGAPDFFGTLFEPDYKGARAFRSFRDARAWARESGVSSKIAWKWLSAAGRLPADIPASPETVFRSEWLGWADFFDKKRKGDSSFIERVLAFEVAQFVPLNETVRELTLLDGRKKRPDMVLRDHKVIVEYDGAYWHKNAFQRDARAAALLREDGWLVVRVREYPLALTSHHDVDVNPAQSLHQKAVVLLKHLAALGILGEDGCTRVEQYEQNGRLFSTAESVAASVGWRKFEEAREFARSLRLPNENAWRLHWEAPGNPIPRDIPKRPASVYRLQWTGYADFLSVETAKEPEHELG